MKMARIWTFLVAAGVLAGSQTAWADGWSLGNLVPFAKSDKAGSSTKRSRSPSALDQLGSGTKKVVHATTDLVTLKWLAPKPAPEKKNNYNYWTRHSRTTKPPKRPFFSFLFPPKEPPQPLTLGEWMAQERLDP